VYWIIVVEALYLLIEKLVQSAALSSSAAQFRVDKNE